MSTIDENSVKKFQLYAFYKVNYEVNYNVQYCVEKWVSKWRKGLQMVEDERVCLSQYIPGSVYQTGPA